MCIPIITGKVDMAEKELEIMEKRLNETVESKKELNISKHEVILKLLNEGELKNGS